MRVVLTCLRVGIILIRDTHPVFKTNWPNTYYHLLVTKHRRNWLFTNKQLDTKGHRQETTSAHLQSHSFYPDRLLVLNKNRTFSNHWKKRTPLLCRLPGICKCHSIKEKKKFVSRGAWLTATILLRLNLLQSAFLYVLTFIESAWRNIFKGGDKEDT